MIRSKEEAQKILDNVVHDFRFYVQDGRFLSNLQELQQALKDMPLEVYHHHVSEHHNDFSLWIRQVINDEVLAKKLTNISKTAAAKIVQERIAMLQAKIDGNSLKKKDSKKKTARKPAQKKAVRKKKSTKKAKSSKKATKKEK